MTSSREIWNSCFWYSPPNFTWEKDRPLIYIIDNNNNNTAAFRSYHLKLFDKTSHDVEVFQKLLSDSDWWNFFNQDCVEGIFTIFGTKKERALKKCNEKKSSVELMKMTSPFNKSRWQRKLAKLYKQSNSIKNPKDEKIKISRMILWKNLLQIFWISNFFRSIIFKRQENAELH